MSVLVTGSSGTVGSALTQYLRDSLGVDVIGWDREAAPPDDREAVERCVADAAPYALFHLAVPSQPTGREDEGRLVTETWTEQLARLAAEHRARFVFTSSVMVYTDAAEGPFAPDTPADAADGYGAQKLRAEARALAVNPAARVVRLGWQMGLRPEGHTMTAQLHRRMQDEGRIGASRRWLLACSFLPDTAAGLWAAAHHPPGRYHLDSNRGWSFYDIARALSARLDLGWNVEPDDAFEQDQRLTDPRLVTPSLRVRLQTLPARGE